MNVWSAGLMVPAGIVGTDPNKRTSIDGVPLDAIGECGLTKGSHAELYALACTSVAAKGRGSFSGRSGEDA